jgi:lipoate-protein ligase A
MDVLEIYQGGGGLPSEDLALEGWMLERAAEGVCCAFMYSWEGPVVVLGYSQDVDDVDLSWCRDHGVPVLRRLTGGTGVVHRRDLAVSVALPTSHPWAAGVVDLYRRFLAVLEPALKSAGGDVHRKQNPRRASMVRSPICFEDQLSDTLLVNGRKAVGCAQTRRRGAVMIHAAILLGLDSTTYARVFQVEERRVQDGLAPAVPDGDWRDVGRSVMTELARALEFQRSWKESPTVPDRHLAPYLESRWSPVSDGCKET